MFSSSALGGSICLRCQIRAVARRGPPLLAAAQVRGRRRRRQYASNATSSRPEDVTPVADTRGNHRDTEQRLAEPRQPQPNENSPSVVAAQSLPDPPQDAPSNSLDLPDGSMTENHLPHGINGITEHIQEPEADIDLVESTIMNRPDYRVKDGKDEGQRNQEDEFSTGQSRGISPSKNAGSLADRTCQHCRKVFSQKSSLDDHTKQGCSSLKPPPNEPLKCTRCGERFETRQQFFRHLGKKLCFRKDERKNLAGNKDGHKMEGVSSQAAAEFSRSKASARRNSTISHDWGLLQRQEVRPQAAAAGHKPDNSAGGYRTGSITGNMQADPEMNHGINTRADSEAIIPDETATSRDRADEGRSEEISGSPLVRRIGQAVHTTRERKRQHRRGDMVLVEDASRLGVESLGKAAEVIVLRDGRQWEKKAPPVEASPEKMDSGVSFMETVADMFGEEVSSADDIEENIHGLKPGHQIVSAREFKSLFTTLMDGFTILQLEKYVVWHREQSILESIKDETFGEGETLSEAPKVTESLLQSQEYSWMTEQAHWIPQVEGAVEEAQYPLAGYVTKSMSPKQRLVVQLMRECWDVSIQELLDGNGCVDIRVRDLEFKLLTLGTQKWLQRISRLFLKEGQQIEVRRSSNLVRIRAPKPVAETCVGELDEMLRKTKSKTLKLDQVPMRRLDSEMLEDLGRITNSVVQFGPDGEEIHVSWIDLWDEEAQSTLENKADMVFRLLLTAHTSVRTSNTLAVYPDVEGNGKLLEDRNNKEKLSWTDRRMEWARLCLPLTSKQPRTAKAWPLTTDVLHFKVEPTEEDLAPPTSAYQHKLGNFYQTVGPIGIPQMEEEQSNQLPAQEPATTRTTRSGWRPFKIATNAAFGHVLHVSTPKLFANIAGPDISTNLGTWPRIFTPLIPPVAEIDLPGWTPYDGTRYISSTILMRFVPYTENAESNIHTTRAPPLELRLSGDSSKIKAIHSLRAINRTSISDILLPTEHVDVRATQQEYAELPPSAIDSTEGMEPLLEFLNKSRLDVAKGNLVTPPRLHNLGLPGWLLTPPTNIVAAATNARAKTKKATKKQPPQHLPHTPEGRELRRASYVFAGLEQRYAVESTYDGWKLVYTAIEAGAGGGRRAELSLEAVPGYDVELRRAREAIDATFFLRSIYQLATGQAGHPVERGDGEEQVRTTIRWVR